jgi:hypothetical protein
MDRGMAMVRYRVTFRAADRSSLQGMQHEFIPIVVIDLTEITFSTPPSSGFGLRHILRCKDISWELHICPVVRLSCLITAENNIRQIVAEAHREEGDLFSQILHRSLESSGSLSSSTRMTTSSSPR